MGRYKYIAKPRERSDIMFPYFAEMADTEHEGVKLSDNEWNYQINCHASFPYFCCVSHYS